ncbi:MAG TPA: outer membrane beta-barrel family protein [Chryseosolibacter sp.]
MRACFTLFLTFRLFLSAFAQENELTISGRIADEKDNPIPYASIALLTQGDSTMAGGVVTDEAGTFQLQARKGKYILKITFLSFKEKTIKLTETSGVLDLGLIRLEATARELEEVVITGEKSQMELQLDKRVFNVGKDLANTGGNAADILDNVPSVSVGVDGTVSLRGSENVRILINGKPSGLTLRDPDALRQLQANIVERVEVITNPSSRYDAEGEVGIINIVLKENKQNGVNGTFTATAGYPEFYGGSYALNIRRKKVNFFSSYGSDYRNSPGYNNTFQRFHRTDGIFSSQRNSKQRSTELSHNLRGGFDYFMTDKSSLSGSVMYNLEDGLNKTTLNVANALNNQLQTSSVRIDNEHEDEKNIEGAFNFKKVFSSEEHTFSADVQYIRSRDGEASDYTQSSDSEIVIQRADNIAREENFLVQADYVHPIRDGKAETGFRSTNRKVDNDYGLEQQGASGNWIPFPAFNDNLVYTEHVHAAYVMAGRKFNRLSFQAGLRGEYSDIITELTETRVVNPRDYLNLFPSINLGFDVTKNKTWQLSYSKRINRPRFRDLLPFSNFADTAVLFMGNPNLNPEYTHSFETGYLFNWENGSILSSAYYRYRLGVIERITQVDEDGRTRIIPVNLSTQNAYGLEFNVSLSAKRWWQFNTSANFYRAVTEGRYEDDDFFSDTYTFNSRTTSKLTLFGNVNFQSSFNYRAPRITPQGKQLSSYNLDFALAKDILKGNATITANVRDVLNTRKNRSITEILPVEPEDQYFYSETNGQGRPRQFRLTFTYRLNQNKERKERRDDRENEQEDNGGDFMP